MKLFVWDLHGTLEQGNEWAVVDISNRILERFGHAERFSDIHAKQLYGRKWYQYFEFLLPHETADRHSELQAACFTFSNSPEGVQIIAKHMRPSAHAFDVLQAIQGRHHQVVISNTTPASLPIFIKALNMERYFGPANALAVDQHIKEIKRTKQDLLKAYMQDKKYDELIVIGDSESDMQLARVTGAKAYLYAHKGVPFRTVNDRKINNLKELLKEL